MNLQYKEVKENSLDLRAGLIDALNRQSYIDSIAYTAFQLQAEHLRKDKKNYHGLIDPRLKMVPSTFSVTEDFFI